MKRKSDNDMKRRIYNRAAGRSFRKSWLAACLAAALCLALPSCYDDGVEGDSYYVFVGQTIGDYLDADGRYSEFSAILERAGMKGLMYAYGDYTCFAPTNEAVEEYIAGHFPGSTVETLPDSAVEALAGSHLIGVEYLTSDFATGYLQEPNIYGRKVQVSIEKEYDTALNDIAITKGAVARVIQLDVLCDGVQAYSFAGDGVLVCTPTGSTAYSMSAGGPLVEPTARNIIVTPICSHTIQARPFVTTKDREITVRIGKTGRKNAFLSTDGGRAVRLNLGDVVRVRRSRHETRLVRLKRTSFFEIINNKFFDRRGAE